MFGTAEHSRIQVQPPRSVSYDQRYSRLPAFVFGDSVPPISSTKSLTGHSLGAAGVQESIYSLLMMEHNFFAASAHIDELDPEAADFPIILERKDDVTLDCVISNSFGFGGTNATLAFKRYDG